MNDLSHAIPLPIFNKLLIYNRLEGRVPKLGSDEEYPTSHADIGPQDPKRPVAGTWPSRSPRQFARPRKNPSPPRSPHSPHGPPVEECSAERQVRVRDSA